jgi:hypothetical protein
MAVTIQNVVDRARETLNDDDKVRWEDAEALSAAQEALDAVFMLRPDLFITQLATFDSSALTIDDNFPIEARYRRQVEDYIIFRCELKDDEAVETGRSESAYKFFVDRLVS